MKNLTFEEMSTIHGGEVTDEEARAFLLAVGLGTCVMGVVAGCFVAFLAL